MISYIETQSHVLNRDYGDAKDGDIFNIEFETNGFALCSGNHLVEGNMMIIPISHLDQLFAVIDDEDDDAPTLLSGVGVEIVTATDKYRHTISFASLDDVIFGRGISSCSNGDIFDIIYGKLLSQMRSILSVMEELEGTMVETGVL